MQNIVQFPNVVNNRNIENKKIFSGRDPNAISQDGLVRGFSGDERDFQQLRDAVLSRRSVQAAWLRMALMLTTFFGDTYQGRAKELFIEWLAGCGDFSEPPPNDPASVWQETLAELEDVFPDLRSQSAGTLSDTIGFIRLFDPRIQWPEVEPTGKPRYNSQTNIRHFLGALGIDLWKDEHAIKYHIAGFPPLTELNDESERALWLKADTLGLKPRKEFFRDVILNIARENGKHPLRDQLKTLESTWDGKSRIDSWLIDYTGAADTPLNRAFGRLFLLAAVRRVRRPGVKFDFLLTLEGKQGLGKSSAGAILAGKDMFTDCLELGAGAKNTVEQTGGKWIVEFSELSGMGRREQETVKAMLSRTHDTARMSYEKSTSTVPRQFVMIGTTNESEYLRDTTGARRFWTVQVGEVDLMRLKKDRDQLWAEAAFKEAEQTAREERGEVDPDELLKLPRGLWEAAAVEQEKRAVIDPIEECLRSVLTTASGEMRTGTIEVDYLYQIIGASSEERRNQSVRSRLGRIMTKLGYTSARPYRNGKRLNVYQRPDADGSVDEILSYKADTAPGNGLLAGQKSDMVFGHGLFANRKAS